MMRYLLSRPVSVLLAFIAVMILGGITFFKIPISLLPDVDVPEIAIRIDYPNTPAATMEQNILKPIRENLATLDHLETVNSRAASHTGIIRLRFDYGTRMNLAYIEVNEKLDRLTNLLPRDMPRPQVIRASTADIPVIRIQVIPREIQGYQLVSDLTKKVLVKRLEQLNGVSVVDVNGVQKGIIAITPNRSELMALNMDEMWLANAIRAANQQLGSLSVKDGQYRYFIRLGDQVKSASDIAGLPIRTPGGAIVPLSKLAGVKEQPEVPTGYHLYNGKPGLVITVQKQAQARMNDLIPRIKEAVKQFQKDYPQVRFAITRDQTSLLHAGVNNLAQSLLLGGALAIVILFFFLGNYASPILMGISIPVSLVISFFFFYLLNISFNIISLSGLALGLGMLIDNSIIVLDRITRKRKAGLSMTESSVEGVREVAIPVINQVLTTVSVYAPLVLLSGIAGALIFDQSIALTILLGVSLLVAFVLVPLLYKLFLQHKEVDQLREDSRIYAWVTKGYHRMIRFIFKRKKLFFILTLCLMPVGFLLIPYIPVTALPEIENRETLVKINWNAPIDAIENLDRVKHLDSLLIPYTQVREVEVGIPQFLQQQHSTIQHAAFYFASPNEKIREKADHVVKEWLQNKEPQSTWEMMKAPNAFTQLFSSNDPYFEARFRPLQNEQPNTDTSSGPSIISTVMKEAGVQHWEPGDGLIKAPDMDIKLNYEKMAIYGISRNQIQDMLQTLFGRFAITELKQFGEVKSVQFHTSFNPTTALLQTPVRANDSSWYPLHNFLSLSVGEGYKFITADKAGPYRSVLIPHQKKINFTDLQSRIRTSAAEAGYGVSFSGTYFQNRARLGELLKIFLIVLALMYFLLAMEYENLIHPLIVLLTIPLGIAGSMILLFLTGSSLNVMTAIGFVVVLGLVIDDPILKIETINQLRKQYGKGGMAKDKPTLERCIHEAGEICLKPVLMTTVTTCLALLPMLFFGGIGNELQRSLVYVVVGGLIFGTFFTLWFIPLAYWFITRKK